MSNDLRLKDLLWDMFGDLDEIYPDFTIIGDEATFSFDDDRYGKLAFTKYATHGTANANVFNGCEINIMSRTKGQIEKKCIAFADVFDSILDLNHPNKIGKHIWLNRGYDWYGKPTEKDRADMFNAVKTYLEMFRVREKEVTHKTPFEQMLDAATQRTSNENTVHTGYNNAIKFITDLQKIAAGADYFEKLDKEKSGAFKKELFDKLLNFNEKDLLKGNGKTEPERE